MEFNKQCDFCFHRDIELFGLNQSLFYLLFMGSLQEWSYIQLAFGTPDGCFLKSMRWQEENMLTLRKISRKQGWKSYASGKLCFRQRAYKRLNKMQKCWDLSEGFIFSPKRAKTVLSGRALFYQTLDSVVELTEKYAFLSSHPKKAKNCRCRWVRRVSHLLSWQSV